MISKHQNQALIDLSAYAENWKSPYVERQMLKEFSGGALNSRTMANHDSAGTGPTGRIKIGRKVIYPVQDLITWLEGKASLPKQRTEQEITQ